MDNQLMVQNQAPVTMVENRDFIMDLTAPRTISYCSMKPQNEKEEVQLFNAMNNPQHRLAECINMKLDIKDVYVEVVQMVNQATGVIQPAPRIVLIDTKNEGYTCVSLGVFGALQKIFQIKGEPTTWQHPLKIEVKSITKGAGNSIRNILTLNLA